VLAKAFADDISRWRARRSGSLLTLAGMGADVAVSDFSGLVSSPWAFARAAAMAANGLTGAVASATSAFTRSKLMAPDLERLARRPCRGLLGILRHQLFQVGLGALVLLVGRAGAAVGAANSAQLLRHMSTTGQLLVRRGGSYRTGEASRRPGRSAKLSLRSEEMLYSGSAWIVSSTHFPSPVMIDSTADRALAPTYYAAAAPCAFGGSLL